MTLYRAVVKFNGGRGALLCNGCHIVIRTGIDHDDREHFCDACQKANGEFKTETKP